MVGSVRLLLVRKCEAIDRALKREITGVSTSINTMVGPSVQRGSHRRGRAAAMVVDASSVGP